MYINFWNRYKKWAFYFVFGVFIAVVIVFWAVKRENRLEADYVAAEQLWQKWSETSDSDELESLEKILSRRPELASLYGPEIAQELVSANSSSQMHDYAKQAFHRTDVHPYYKSYAQTALTISDGNYEQALQEALELKGKLFSDQAFLQQMKDHRDLGSALVAFNLLRVALLYQQLEDGDEELKAWKEFEDYDQKEKIVAHFTMQNQSLLDYLAMRKKMITEAFRVSIEESL